MFDQKNEKFLSSCFTTDEEIFVLLNPSGKHSEKQCFIILSSFSHNLTGKLIFSQKEWVRHQIRFAFCYWCLQMLFLMLFYMVRASKVLKLKDLRMERVSLTPDAISFELLPFELLFIWTIVHFNYCTWYHVSSWNEQ